MFPHQSHNDNRSVSEGNYHLQQPFQPLLRHASYDSQAARDTYKQAPSHTRTYTLNPDASIFQPPRLEVPHHINSNSNSRPIEDRTSLGRGRPQHLTHDVPPHLVSMPTQHTSTHAPPMTRSWTLDSPARTSLSPLSYAHQALPLTRSPLQPPMTYDSPSPRKLISPAHSIVSALPDVRERENSWSLSSPSPSSDNSRKNRPGLRRGLSGRIGGPPKAILGGPGGKTFDEMMVERSPASASALSFALTPDGPSSALGLGSKTPSRSTSGTEIKFMGKPVPIRLPPLNYSPPDSPAKPPPPSSEGDQPKPPSPKLPRKEAYPWPAKRVLLSPKGFPLPISPEAAMSDDVYRRASIGSTASLSEVASGDQRWKVKEVIVAVPDADGWEKIRPPERSVDPSEGETSSEMDVVQSPRRETPTPPQETKSTSWADMSFSPPLPTPAKTDPSPQKRLALESTPEKDEPSHEKPQSQIGLGLLAHPSLPPKPITREEAMSALTPATPTSQATDVASPTKRTFGVKELGNSTFLRRQLGGVLRGPTERAKRQSTDDTPKVEELRKTSPDDVFVNIPLTANPKYQTEEIPLRQSKLRAWDEYNDNESDDNERDAGGEPTPGKSKRNRDDAEESDRTDQAKNLPNALEEARQKALASRRRKRDDTVESKNEEGEEKSDKIEHKGPASLEEARQKALDSRRSRFTPFLQRQLGGLLQAKAQSTEKVEPSTPDNMRMDEKSELGPELSEDIEGSISEKSLKSGADKPKPDDAVDSPKEMTDSPSPMITASAPEQSIPATVSDPPAKRLRPTAEPWRPTRGPPASKKGKSDSTAILKRTAQAFMPRLPSTRSRGDSIASATGSANGTQLRPNAASFIPDQSTGDGGFTFSFPRIATSIETIRRNSISFERRGSLISNTSSEGQRLRPTAAPFVPVSFGAGSKPNTDQPFNSEDRLRTTRSTPQMPSFGTPVFIKSARPTGTNLAAIVLRHPETVPLDKGLTSVSFAPPLSALPPHPLSSAAHLIEASSRVSTPAEPILCPAELVPNHAELASFPTRDEKLEESRYRVRAGTVAFGPPTEPTPIEQGDDVDLKGLFFREPATSGSDEQSINPWREEASPRVPLEDWRSDGRAQNQSRSRERDIQRASPRSCPTSLRAEGHSYHPQRLPVSDDDSFPALPVDQVIIHPSHPFLSHHTAVETSTCQSHKDENPDVPHSAHTHEPSGSGVDRSMPMSASSHESQSSTSRALPSIPLSSAHDEGSLQNVKVISAQPEDPFSTPVKLVSKSTGDTQTAGTGAYMTADGSPLVPSHLEPLPEQSPTHLSHTQSASYVTLATPKAIRRLPEITIFSRQNQILPQSELRTLIRHGESWAESLERRVEAFDRSAAPSPELGEDDDAGSANDGEEETIQDERKFRNWTFPLLSDENQRLVTHSRRHTMSASLPPADNDGREGEPQSSDVESFAERVHDLREFLRPPSTAPEGDRGSSNFPFPHDDYLSTRTSSEFPMRRAQVQAEENQGWQKVLEVLQELKIRDEDLLGGLKDMKEVVDRAGVNALQPSEDKAIERVTSMLEEHSLLLASIQAAQVAPPTQSTGITPESGPTEGVDDEITRSKELFAAILTGQHAILKKFDEVAFTRLSGVSELAEVVDALRDMQVKETERLLVQQTTSNSTRHERTSSTSLSEIQIQLADSLVESTKLKTERKILLKQMAQLEEGRDRNLVELKDQSRQIVELRVRDVENKYELDKVLSRALAAELERDALARPLNEGREREEELKEQVRGAKDDLENERRLSQQAEESQRLQLESTMAKVEEASTNRTLTELKQSGMLFHDEVLARLGRLDDVMHESMGTRAKEYDNVHDRNRLLQGEVDSLRERLEDSADRYAKLQLSTTTTLSTTEFEQNVLRKQMEDEQIRREESERHEEVLSTEVDQLKRELMSVKGMLMERTQSARLSEVRLQALAQETVYWRQFALDYDRREFRKYMDGQPFRSSNNQSTLCHNGNNEDKDEKSNSMEKAKVNVNGEKTNQDNIVSRTDEQGRTVYELAE